MVSLVAPPENFAMVWKGIYRSAFPSKKNFSFVSRLGLRTVLFLCPEDYPESHISFYSQNNIQLLQFGVIGNKEPFDEIPISAMCEALRAILDKSNLPLLIHCNQGKHRTGCLVGCLRKVHGWSLVSIFEEYRRFAGIKARVHDEQFIERFPTCSVFEGPETVATPRVGPSRKKERAQSIDSFVLPRRIVDYPFAKSLDDLASITQSRKAAESESGVRRSQSTSELDDMFGNTSRGGHPTLVHKEASTEVSKGKNLKNSTSCEALPPRPALAADENVVEGELGSHSRRVDAFVPAVLAAIRQQEPASEGEDILAVARAALGSKACQRIRRMGLAS
ncbi:MAG: hypothetical protein SGPRY_000933 [Prymnesium sp.]